MSPTPDGVREAALVTRIRAGDESVFRELFELYSIPLTIFADRMLLAPDMAEETVADAFLALWETRERFAPQHTVQSYLYRAVRNRTLNLLRGQAREDARLRTLARSDELPGGGTDTSPIDEALDVEQRGRILRDIIGRLPESRRTVVTLRWQRGLSVEEIAEVVQSTPAAVKMQLSRALAQLRTLVPDTLA